MSQISIQGSNSAIRNLYSLINNHKVLTTVVIGFLALSSLKIISVIQKHIPKIKRENKYIQGMKNKKYKSLDHKYTKEAAVLHGFLKFLSPETLNDSTLGEINRVFLRFANRAKINDGPEKKQYNIAVINFLKQKLEKLGKEEIQMISSYKENYYGFCNEGSIGVCFVTRTEHGCTLELLNNSQSGEEKRKKAIEKAKSIAQGIIESSKCFCEEKDPKTTLCSLSTIPSEKCRFLNCDLPKSNSFKIFAVKFYVKNKP